MKRLPSLRKHFVALGIFILMFMFFSTVDVQAKPGAKYQKMLRKQANKTWNKRQKSLKRANKRIARWPGNTKAKGFAYASIDHTVKCPTGKCNKPK
jgi:predicted Zn-ribbon and HTH transcriptional regulator